MQAAVSKRVEESKSASGEIPADYNFRFAGEEEIGGTRCYVIAFFVRGQDPGAPCWVAWIDAETHAPVRIEGNGTQVLLLWFQESFTARCRQLARHSVI